MPLTATWLAAKAAQEGSWASGLASTVGGAKYVGLLYPMLIALSTVIIGIIFVRDKKGVIMHEDVTKDDVAASTPIPLKP